MRTLAALAISDRYKCIGSQRHKKSLRSFLSHSEWIFFPTKFAFWWWWLLSYITSPFASPSTAFPLYPTIYFSPIHRARKFSYIITITPLATMHSFIPFTIRFCRAITNANFHLIQQHAQKIPFFMVNEMSLAHKRLQLYSKQYFYNTFTFQHRFSYVNIHRFE